MTKIKVKTRVVRVDAFTVINRAVEEGAAYGWRRAFKHTDKPTDAAAIEAITNGVMNALCDVLKMTEEEDE